MEQNIRLRWKHESFHLFLINSYGIAFLKTKLTYAWNLYWEEEENFPEQDEKVHKLG